MSCAKDPTIYDGFPAPHKVGDVQCDTNTDACCITLPQCTCAGAGTLIPNVSEMTFFPPICDSLPYREHRFWLRPGFEVRINLPEDLTDIEADRLATFIGLLPFEDKA